MRRKFSRPGARGIWLPTESSRGESSALVTTAATGFAVSYAATPLIANDLDAPADPTTLASILGGSALDGLLSVTTKQGYLHKRTVGSVFVSSEEAAAGAQTRYAFFGLIVDRVDENGGLDNVAAWNPFSADSQQKRWLFKRYWQLDGSGAFGAPALGWSNREYGSLREGTHVDCKSKARVGYGERFFVIYGVQNGPGNSATNTRFTWYLRMFANPNTGPATR